MNQKEFETILKSRGYHYEFRHGPGVYCWKKDLRPDICVGLYSENKDCSRQCTIVLAKSNDVLFSMKLEVLTAEELSLILVLDALTTVEQQY